MMNIIKAHLSRKADEVLRQLELQSESLDKLKTPTPQVNEKSAIQAYSQKPEKLVRDAKNGIVTAAQAAEIARLVCSNDPEQTLSFYQQKLLRKSDAKRFVLPLCKRQPARALEFLQNHILDEAETWGLIRDRAIKHPGMVSKLHANSQIDDQAFVFFLQQLLDEGKVRDVQYAIQHNLSTLEDLKLKAFMVLRSKPQLKDKFESVGLA